MTEFLFDLPAFDECSISLFPGFVGLLHIRPCGESPADTSKDHKPNVPVIRDFGKVKAEFFAKNYPAWTAVGVRELALPQLLVEIKATAVIGSGVS